MDHEALHQWTTLEDEYDLEVDKYLAARLGDTPSGGEVLDAAALERLADLRNRRDAARANFLQSLPQSQVAGKGEDPPDTASIIILGRD
jgi:hypothetical protein